MRSTTAAFLLKYTTARRLNSGARKRSAQTPKLLYLQRDDLMRHEAAGITTDQFPPQLVMNNVSYALAYNFAPGKKR